MSPEGSQIAFTTVESLVGVDTDDHMDVYQRSVAGVSLVAASRDGATVSASKKAGRSRTVLLSAESVAPKMKVGTAKQKSARFVTLKLKCPKAEETGPCRGTVKLRPKTAGGAKGKGTFRIKSGAGRLVRVKLASPVKRQQSWRARVQVTAADALGNKRRSAEGVLIRR